MGLRSTINYHSPFPASDQTGYFVVLSECVLKACIEYFLILINLADYFLYCRC